MEMSLSERIRVVIVLGLGILAIGLLTWGVGKIYLELVGQSGIRNVSTAIQAEGRLDSAEDSVLILPEVKFWFCQMGVFQSEQNAYGRKEELRQLGLGAEVIGSNPWIVGLGWSQSSENLQVWCDYLAGQGIETLTKQITLEERSFRVAGTATQLTVELLTNANAVLQEGITAELLIREQQIWDALAGDHPPKELEGLHNIYNQMRAGTTDEGQKVLICTLFCESQRVINILSGK